MVELVKYIARSLVENPDAVDVREVESEEGVTIELRVAEDDMGKVNGIAIGAVFLVLLLSLKSISLPVILVMAIETAIWINMAIPISPGRSSFTWPI